MYLVTAASGDAVSVQKVLHPLVPGQTKLMSKTYETRPKHVRILHRPHPVPGQLDPNPSMPVAVRRGTVNQWNPVNRSDESDDDSDDGDKIEIN